MIETWILKEPTVRVVKATLDNINDLKRLLPEKKDTIELLNYKTNQYYKTSKLDGNYYVIKETGMFGWVLGYIHLPIGDYLVKNGSNLSRYTEEDLKEQYKLVDK